MKKGFRGSARAAMKDRRFAPRAEDRVRDVELHEMMAKFQKGEVSPQEFEAFVKARMQGGMS